MCNVNTGKQQACVTMNAPLFNLSWGCLVEDNITTYKQHFCFIFDKVLAPSFALIHFPLVTYYYIVSGVSTPACSSLCALEDLIAQDKS